MATVSSMDFFAHQDQARKKTHLLVIYYILAVILIMLAVYVAFALVFIGVGAESGGEKVKSLCALSVLCGFLMLK